MTYPLDAWGWFYFFVQGSFSIWEQRLAAESLSFPPIWSSLIGQEVRLLTLLLSRASRLHHPSVWFVAGNLPTTHLSGQGKICTDPIFWACDTIACFQSNTQIFSLCLILETECCHIQYIYSLKYSYFHSNKFSFNPSATPRWLTLWWVTARNAGEK